MEYSDILGITCILGYLAIALCVTGICEKELKMIPYRDRNDSSIAILIGVFWIFFIPLFVFLKGIRKS